MNEPDAAAMDIELALATDLGLLRERNEDAVAGNADLRWALVADGMGGHRGGDVAAAMVSAELTARLDTMMAARPGVSELSESLRSAIQDANLKVFEHGQGDSALRGMGSTVVVACVVVASLIIAHVGDSRAYMLRGEVLEQLTHDHSLLQELLDGGMITAAEARRAPGRGVLTRSMGVEPSVDIDVESFSLIPGDLVLLCSDGLTEMVGDQAIADILRGRGNDLGALARQLIERANAGGGRDNVSVALLSAKPVAAA